MKYNVQDYSVLYNEASLYVRADNLLTCRKHVHHRIISLRGEDCAHKTSLTPPLFIEVPVPIQESVGLLPT
jgi:hypothetical protein